MSGAFFWEDDKVRSPSENLAINRLLFDDVASGKIDFIARVYTHSKGLILGSGEDLVDVDLVNANRFGYEVIYRPSGGSVIVSDSDLTLCYSVFFKPQSFGIKEDINEVYKSITIPLAKNLGDSFSVEGTYYMRVKTSDGFVPIAGHAIKGSRGVYQFDGIVNKKKFDVDLVGSLIKLRELYEDSSGVNYLFVDNEIRDMKGNVVSLSKGDLSFVRSEKLELERVVGLSDLGVSESFFVDKFYDSLVNTFGGITKRDSYSFSDDSLNKMVNEIKGFSYNNFNSSKYLGHCFVDLVDFEPKIHYKKE